MDTVNPTQAKIQGRIVIDFQGDVTAVLPVAETDEQTAALLQRLERAAETGELSGLV